MPYYPGLTMLPEMTASPTLLQDFQRTVHNSTVQARQCGAIKPLCPQWEQIHQSGVRFLAQRLPGLTAKDNAKKQETQATPGQDFNPFLPYEAALFVTHLSDTHLCLLNKFGLAEHHLLVVTREFVEQGTVLTLNDFEAVRLCLAQMDALVMLNSGKAAGGTQRHRHLHVLPLPIADAQLPIAPIVAAAELQDGMRIAPQLPFIHGIARLNPDWLQTPLHPTAQVFTTYQQLLSTVGIMQPSASHPLDYNLLLTPTWMMVVPREQASAASIAINAAGFAGLFCVKDDQQMQVLKEWGPMELLRQVAKLPD